MKPSRGPKFDRKLILAAYPHYAAIRDEATLLGLPTSFRRDLTLHDRRELAARDSREPFVWALSESGTQIVWPVRCGLGWPDPIASLERCFRGVRLYTWNGRVLRRASADVAKAFLNDLALREERLAS